MSLYRVSDDVLIYASLRQRPDGTWRFATAFPLNGAGVVRNDPDGGRVHVDLDVDAWRTYPD